MFNEILPRFFSPSAAMRARASIQLFNSYFSPAPSSSLSFSALGACHRDEMEGLNVTSFKLRRSDRLLLRGARLHEAHSSEHEIPFIVSTANRMFLCFNFVSLFPSSSPKPSALLSSPLFASFRATRPISLQPKSLSVPTNTINARVPLSGDVCAGRKRSQCAREER